MQILPESAAITPGMERNPASGNFPRKSLIDIGKTGRMAGLYSLFSVIAYPS